MRNRRHGWAAAIDAHERRAALLRELLVANPATIASYPRVPYATKNDPGLVQPVIDVIARYGFIPRSFPATELRAPGL